MEDQLVEEYHVLVLGALKKCHITSFHPMFEDYLQIARWVLVDAHRTFIKDGKSMDSFHNYVFQRIYWKITDEIRKELTYKDRLQTGEDDELFRDLPDTRQEDLIEINELLEKCQTILTENEKLFLEEAYVHELSITAIARKHHVSRQSVYNWRDKVALKTITFFEK